MISTEYRGYDVTVEKHTPYLVELYAVNEDTMHEYFNETEDTDEDQDEKEWLDYIKESIDNYLP